MIKRLLASALLVFSLACGAQTLTAAQKTALSADIAANPTLSALLASGSYGPLASYYNSTDATWTVWRTSVPIDDIMRNGMDWSRVDNLSVGKARIWDWMGRLGTLDCSKPNVRTGIDATWVGTAADLAVRATVYTHCKRVSTRFERLFSVGTGSEASPATMGVDASGRIIEGPASDGVFQELQ